MLSPRPLVVPKEFGDLMGVIAIIPARGGSTRVPRKNVKPFNDEPMLSWPIAAARGSQTIDRVIVSTDDDAIAQVAEASGADVPFMRPGELSSAHAGTAPVIVHALDNLGIGDDEVVMCLYSTAPVPSWILDEAIRLATGHRESFVISVGRHRSPMERTLRASSDGFMMFESASFLFSRTQDLPQRYFDAGKFYIANAGIWRTHETMMSKPFVPYFLPEWESVDMDEPDDWPIAEALHRAFVLEAL